MTLPLICLLLMMVLSLFAFHAKSCEYLLAAVYFEFREFKI